MSRGKHLSLEEARRLCKLEQFAKEHPYECDAELFERLLDRAAKPRSSAAASGTPTRDASAGSSGTRTRRGS